MIEVAVHVISASSEFRQCTYVKESILRNLKSLGNDRTFQSNKYVGGSVILFIRNLKNSLLVFLKIRENLEKVVIKETNCLIDSNNFMLDNPLEVFLIEH